MLAAGLCYLCTTTTILRKVRYQTPSDWILPDPRKLSWKEDGDDDEDSDEALLDISCACDMSHFAGRRMTACCQNPGPEEANLQFIRWEISGCHELRGWNDYGRQRTLRRTLQTTKSGGPLTQ